ncbi:MAG TPA: hypothetical protein VM008_19735 [Phycisphaerae bacterium]|nr:hypothetical protein [Phycisphaerae bacterium]
MKSCPAGQCRALPREAGLNAWGRPSNHNLHYECAAEAFLRIQVAQHCQLTARYLALFDGSNPPGDNVAGVFEFRWRIAF